MSTRRHRTRSKCDNSPSGEILPDEPTPRFTHRHRDDRGETMVMTVVLISFLMLAAWTLVSASQQWGARRDVQAAAAAAARAGAQISQDEIRRGSVAIDPALASDRANGVLAASGYSGSVSVDGRTVTVTATAPVTYSFPAPGFPATLTATSSANAIAGVLGNEGG